MTLFLIGIGAGFLIGAFVCCALCEIWIQRYTTGQDQKNAVFGNRRYNEGWIQGQEALIKESEKDGGI